MHSGQPENYENIIVYNLPAGFAVTTVLGRPDETTVGIVIVAGLPGLDSTIGDPPIDEVSVVPAITKSTQCKLNN